MTGKTLFVTERGLLGLGFPEIQAGDLLVVLRGAAVPHVLRQSQEKYPTWTFQGEVYVRGIMHGEAEKHDENGVEPRPEVFMLV